MLMKHYMSFSLSILWPVTIEDQVHIRMSSLQEIVAATPTNQVTATTHELYADLCELSVMWCDDSTCVNCETWVNCDDLYDEYIFL
jgi:hypothetical protein